MLKRLPLRLGSLAALLGILILGIMTPTAAGQTIRDPSRQAAAHTASLPATALPIEDSGKLTLVYDFPPVDVVQTGVESPGGWHRVTMGDLPLLTEPGKPVLPYQLAQILLPAGQALAHIDVQLEGETQWSTPVHPLLAQQQEPACEVRAGVCPLSSLDDTIELPAYPEAPYQILSTQQLEGYTLLLVRLFPVRYWPATSQLTFISRLSVTLTLEPSFHAASRVPRPGAGDRVRAIVDNPQALESYTAVTAYDLSVQRTGSLVNPSDPYDYILITSSALSPTFQSLVDWRKGQGLRARIFTTEAIFANYSGTRPDGGNDGATAIRNFLIDAYTLWSGSDHPLQYVLLGGDTEIIPVRYVSVQAGIYSSNNLISDLYYVGLDGTWDTDNDGRYGEGDAAQGGEGTRGEEVDWYAELYVGRAPVSNATQASNFINKLITYESDPAAISLDKGLMLGERLDAQTYGGYSMDELIARAPSLEATRIYDRDGGWNSGTLIPHLNTGPHLVNHLGHANSGMVLKLYRYQVSALTNTAPFLVHTQGCLPAKFDENDAIGEYFVFSEHGAFGFIGNTQYGWYLPGSTNGASQLFHRAFIDALFTKGIHPLGQALQDAKESTLGAISGAGPERWVGLELVLLGDPATPIVTSYEDPVAHITAPQGGYPAAGTLDIRGSAHAGTAPGAEFSNYRLDYGTGTSPSTWTQIGVTTTTPVTEGTLGNWDTGMLSEGTYALRLTTTSPAGRSSTDKVVLSLDHTDITAPEADTFWGVNAAIPITGTATRGDFQHYTLEWGAGSAPSVWTPVLTATTPVVRGHLGIWNASTIAEAGYYTLRLSVQGSGYASSDTASLIVDPRYQAGWPQTVGQRISESSIAVGDLDGDGELEVVAAEGMYNCGGALEGGRCGAYGMRLYAWHHDGRPLAGWPQMPGSDNRLTTPALADLEADGDLEILVGSIDGSVYVYAHDGTMVTGWPQATGDLIYGAPSAGELDGDEELEVVACSYDGKCYAWQHDGSPVPGWPQASGNCFASPLLVDLDQDGKDEIITASRSGVVSAFRGDGTALENWPITIGTDIVASPVSGDLDGNGTLEIVVATQNAVYVWGADGTPFAGWPKTGLAWGIESSPALADLNGDGGLDVIVAGGSQILYAWAWNGTPLAGWGTAKAPAARSSPAVGDIDGDRDPEVLIAGYDSDNRLYAWHHDGTAVDGWPRPIPAASVPSPSWERRCSPLLVDLDGDADIEVGLGVETQLFFWDLQGHPQDAPWPTFQANMARRGTAPQPSSLITLTGQVQSSPELLPISGARITVSPGPSSTTDAQGYYTMTIVPGIDRIVTAHAAYYMTGALTHQDLVSDTTGLNFLLYPMKLTYFPFMAQDNSVP